MPTYGAYETNREIAPGHGAVVYAARKTGEADGGNYVVKVFSPPASPDEFPTDQAAAEPLPTEPAPAAIEAIQAQEKAAAASPEVAPILASGREGSDVWYATRFYRRSVERIIQGRVTLGPGDLVHLLQCVVRGALAFKRTCGRGHGNLKPANILIGDAERLRVAEIVVTDPAAGPESEAGRFERADLRAIGMVLYQLVRRREVSDADDWLILPIESSREWTDLFGKDAPAWLSVCNRLLDPQVSLGTFDLERLYAELQQLQPKPPVSRRTIALAAGLVLLGVVGGSVAAWFLNRGTVEFTSDPPGAEILDARQVVLGSAPLKQTLRKGRHVFVARFGELGAMTNVVEVRGRGRHTQQFRFDYGSVVLNTVPPGATVKVGATNLGVTPFTHRYLRPNQEISYRVTRPGYVPVSKVIPIGSNETVQANIVLDEEEQGRPPLAYVDVGSTPRQATVTIQGTGFTTNGTTPNIFGLPEGEYLITAAYRNWPKLELRRKFMAGETNLDIRFPHSQVTFVCEPAGARMMRVGDPEPIAVAPQTIFWPTGLVHLRFEAEGYESAELTTNLVDLQRVTFSPRLKPRYGFVLVRSDPAPAEIYSGNQLLGKTSPEGVVSLSLPPGPYALRARYPGLADLARPATNLAPAQKLEVNFTFDYGWLQLESDPPGAEFLQVNAQGQLQPLPAGRVILPAGNNQIVARHRSLGLADRTNLVALARHKSTPQRVDFDYGYVRLTSKPPGAAIREAGQLVGQTPASFLVPFGRRDYELAWETKTNLASATVAARRQTNDLFVDFTEPPLFTNGVDMVLVKVNNGLYVGKFEVSQAQYEKLMGAKTVAEAAPALPVTLVGITNALAFCARLTEREKLSLGARGLTNWTYQLPTEREWNAFADPAFGGLAGAIFSNNSIEPKPLDAARGSTNSLGLFDVYGNVGEWCLDDGGRAVVLGGGYSQRNPGQVPANRFRIVPDPLAPSGTVVKGSTSVGFRCVLKPPGPTVLGQAGRSGGAAP